MYPVTSPVTACRHVAPASVARHGTQVPHPSTPRHSHTQTDDTQATQPCASARVHGRGPGPGGRARGGAIAHLTVFAVYRRLCSPAGSPRSRSWRRSGTNTAAGTTRTSAAGTLLSRPRSTGFLSRFRSDLVD